MLSSIEYILLCMYIITVSYLITFRIGLRKKNPITKINKFDNKRSSSEKEIYIVLPIYHERDSIITSCMESICRQEGIKINIIVVIREPEESQLSLIKHYAKRVKSLRIIRQKKGQSEVSAYKEALYFVKTEYVCMLNIDAIIFKGSLRELFFGILNEKSDVGFGLRFPKTTTNFGKFAALDKIFRQLLLQKGRGAIGMGYYIPGSFYIIKKRILLEGMNDGYTYDFGLALRLYAKKDTKFTIIPEPLSTELEKSSFKSWCLQYSRWTLGEIGLGSIYIRFFKEAKTKVKVGFAGVLWLWYAMPLSTFLGFWIALLTHNIYKPFIFIYLIYYLFMVLILISLPETRKYGKIYIFSHWLLSSLVKSIGMFLSIYAYIIKKYRSKDTYRIYAR